MTTLTTAVATSEVTAAALRVRTLLPTNRGADEGTAAFAGGSIEFAGTAEPFIGTAAYGATRCAGTARLTDTPHVTHTPRTIDTLRTGARTWSPPV